MEEDIEDDENDDSKPFIIAGSVGALSGMGFFGNNDGNDNNMADKSPGMAATLILAAVSAASTLTWAVGSRNRQ